MLLASTKLNYCKTVKQILNKFGEKENKLLYVGEVTPVPALYNCKFT